MGGWQEAGVVALQRSLGTEGAPLLLSEPEKLGGLSRLLSLRPVSPALVFVVGSFFGPPRPPASFKEKGQQKNNKNTGSSMS